MTNPYRALCAELAEELANEYGYGTEWEEGLPLCGSMCSELLTRARALLAHPKPPSLKEQALEVVTGLEKRWDLQCDLTLLRRALEALDD
jgi:hypothetical protein